MQEASGWSRTPNAARTISCKAWNSPAEYPSWVARCDIKRSVSTVLKPIFSKKVQRQKHPGRWGIVEHQIPSIKVLFKTNTKGHKHPSIRLLSKSKTQLVNQRKQKVAFSPETTHSPEIQSYRTWWGAASPIPKYTPVVYIYTSYNRTHIRNAYIYIYIYINTELLDGNQGHQEETHRPMNEASNSASRYIKYNRRLQQCLWPITFNKTCIWKVNKLACRIAGIILAMVQSEQVLEHDFVQVLPFPSIYRTYIENFF